MVQAERCPVCQEPNNEVLFQVDGYPLHRCRSCGLRYLAPQPDDAALARIYGQHYYDAWGIAASESTVRALKIATFRRRLAELPIPLAARTRVLDVGCATGYFLEAAQQAGLDPFGVELSEFGAKTSASKVGLGHIHHGELEDANFIDHPSGLFSAIFMSDLLEHVRDPHTTLESARSRLEPGGLLVITLPWTNSLSHRLAGRKWLHYKPEHLYYFGTRSMELLLEAHGFTIEQVVPAKKCLSLRYAKTQFSSRNGFAGFFGKALGLLPESLLDLPLWVWIGETTLVVTSRGN